MRDIRIVNLAKVLVNYSVGIKKHHLVKINGEVPSIPLLEAVYEQVIRSGAYPYISIRPDVFAEIFYKNADETQLKYISPISKYEVEKLDAQVNVIAEVNTKHLSNVDPKKMAIAAAARKPLSDRFMQRAAKGELNWVLTLFPTDSSAQDAEMSLTEYEDFVFGAGMLDAKNPVLEWQNISRTQDRILELLSESANLRVIAKDTDIAFNVNGRKWKKCDGHHNFPDGEIFTGPVENSAEGKISFSFPCVHNGREADGVVLVFEKGRVVSASAKKNQEFLKEMINIDQGSSRIGELAIGLNYNIKKFTKNTLFDEKIGGTIHLALGSGYPETGSKNKSGLHWDMVCDLREYGEILLDGKCVYKKGRFIYTTK
jgi:aminopeptidase